MAKSKRPASRRMLIGWTAAIAAVAIILILTGTRNSEAAESTPNLLRVETQTVAFVESYSTKRKYIGRIEAAQQSDLGFELSGRVARMLSDEGQAVRRGQVLAQLDTARLRARRAELEALLRREEARLDEMLTGPRAEVIEQARAGVERWQAESELARLTRERSERAAQRNALSAQRRDEARRTEESAAAQLRSASELLRELETGTRAEQIAAQEAVVAQVESQIASIDVDLGKSSLRAPFAGTVAVRYTDEGRVIGAGDPVVRLLETGRLEARIGVPSAVAAGLESGDELTIEVGEQRLAATVRSVLPQRVATSRTVPVVLSLRDAEGTVRDGDIAEMVREEAITSQGMWLPRTALTEGTEGLWSVYVAELGKDGAPHMLARRQVEVLHADGERAFVRGVLAEGEDVVISGVHRLAPRQRVTVQGS